MRQSRGREIGKRLALSCFYRFYTKASRSQNASVWRVVLHPLVLVNRIILPDCIRWLLGLASLQPSSALAYTRTKTACTTTLSTYCWRTTIDNVRTGAGARGAVRVQPSRSRRNGDESEGAGDGLAIRCGVVWFAFFLLYSVYFMLLLHSCL